MAGPSRYDVGDKEAGIENGILKNKLGITDQKQLDDAETLLLSDSYAYFFGRLPTEKITVDLSLLLSIHKYFLGTLYSWAGQVRTIDISKDGMFFASVKHLGSSLKAFEKILQNNIPRSGDSKKKIAEKIAVIHDEFNAVHPFREGNGRTIRLFLDLLVESLSLHPIDWSDKRYMEACRKGMLQDHGMMADIVYRGLRRSSD